MGLFKFYRGFSTRDYQERGGSFGLFNVQLIEEDLMNELLTIKGERINMPDFGTRIPLLTFEPNDTSTQDILKEDMETVIKNDPRVALQGEVAVIVSEDKHVIIGVAKVAYLEFAVVQDLRIEVSSR